MDEIVFERETLRRALASSIEALDKAADAYDPESDLPVDDVLTCLAVDVVRQAANAYADAIRHRIESRTEARGGGASMSGALRECDRAGVAGPVASGGGAGSPDLVTARVSAVDGGAR
jgi:hypothetical protein